MGDYICDDLFDVALPTVFCGTINNMNKNNNITVRNGNNIFNNNKNNKNSSNNSSNNSNKKNET